MNSIQDFQTSKSPLPADQFNDFVIDCIQDVKGKKIIKLDLTSIDDRPTNYFIICQGESITQVKSIAANIERRVRTELGIKSNHTEGVQNSKWVLVDYFDTIVHVFYPETRQYYDIEDLWSDADSIEFDDM